MNQSTHKIDLLILEDQYNDLSGFYQLLIERMNVRVNKMLLIGAEQILIGKDLKKCLEEIVSFQDNKKKVNFINYIGAIVDIFIPYTQGSEPQQIDSLFLKSVASTIPVVVISDHFEKRPSMDMIYWIKKEDIREVMKNKQNAELLCDNITYFMVSSHPLYKNLQRESIFKQEHVNYQIKYTELGEVQTEYDSIAEVIVHSPGDEVNLSAVECDDFLFDAPVDREKFREEHDRFVNLITGRMPGVRVKRATDVLYDIFQKDDDLLFKFIVEFSKEIPIEFDNIGRWFLDAKNFINNEGILPPWFIAGKKNNQGHWLIPPLPNFVFSRDWGFPIGDSIFLAKMNKRSRKRETLIAKYLLKYHYGRRFVDHDQLKFTEADSIEGGDVVLLPNNNVLIGISERTNLPAIQKLGLFLGGSKKIWATEAPLTHKRSMHLDTYLSVFSKSSCLAFTEPFKGKNVFYELNSDGSVKQLYWEDLETMLKVMGMGKLKVLWIDDSKTQWDDGINVFTLKSSVFIGYRNTVVRKLVHNLGEYIELDTKELIMGRGGPHCMTFPIDRKQTRG